MAHRKGWLNGVGMWGSQYVSLRRRKNGEGVTLELHKTLDKGISAPPEIGGAVMQA